MPTLTGTAAVVSACQSNWEAHKCDCSGFVKAVASDLGVTLTGMANDIVDQIQAAPWTVVPDGPTAAGKAADGFFVVAGLKDNPHGHVVVITGSPLAHDKYPTGYWGRLGGVGCEDQTINWSWNAEDRDKVTYAYCSFGAPA